MRNERGRVTILLSSLNTLSQRQCYFDFWSNSSGQLLLMILNTQFWRRDGRHIVWPLVAVAEVKSDSKYLQFLLLASWDRLADRKKRTCEAISESLKTNCWKRMQGHQFLLHWSLYHLSISGWGLLRGAIIAGSETRYFTAASSAILGYLLRRIYCTAGLCFQSFK